MKTIIIYDETGRIFSQYKTLDLGNIPKGIPYLVVSDYNDDIESETYRPILSVDVTQEPHIPIYGKTMQEKEHDAISLDEYKDHRQQENKTALAAFLKENPLLWIDGLYYGVTQEDQDEMLADKTAYDFKQSLGQTDWKLQWHSIKSACRDFTVEEFAGLLNAIVNFVYPYRQLEMQYKEQIYAAATKEELASLNLLYSVEAINQNQNQTEDTANEQ